MKWQTLKVILGVCFLVGWPAYILTHFPFQADGYRLPSPDKRHSATVMFVSKSPTISRHEQHYEIAVYRGGEPGTPFGWLFRTVCERPYFRKEIPPSSVGQGFSLTRDAIRWDMPQGIVTFALGNTNVTAKLK
jgi:hypothetical protein